MKHTFRTLLIALPMLLVLCQVRAQTNQPGAAMPGPDSERYLLAFDISSGMRARLRSTLAFTRELIESGFYGRAVAGDTIGVWTFNDLLYTGEFPLQVWRPETAPQVAAAITNFIRNQKFRRTAQINQLMEGVAEVAQRSRTLTVIVITDGRAAFTGTPYDGEINAALRASARDAARTKEPVVVVLRTYRGQVIGGSVARPSQRIVFPAYPEQARAARHPDAAKTNLPSKPELRPITRQGPAVETNLLGPDAWRALPSSGMILRTGAPLIVDMSATTGTTAETQAPGSDRSSHSVPDGTGMPMPRPAPQGTNVPTAPVTPIQLVDTSQPAASAQSGADQPVAQNTNAAGSPQQSRGEQLRADTRSDETPRTAGLDSGPTSSVAGAVTVRSAQTGAPPGAVQNMVDSGAGVARTEPTGGSERSQVRAESTKQSREGDANVPGWTLIVVGAGLCAVGVLLVLAAWWMLWRARPRSSVITRAFEREQGPRKH